MSNEWSKVNYSRRKKLPPPRKRIPKEPITSYGIILFTLKKNPQGGITPYYLISQRRDTIEYVCFIRGQYDPKNIRSFFNLMTKDEKNRILNYSFDELWSDLWVNQDHRIFRESYQKAFDKYQRMNKQFLNMINEAEPQLDEPPWGFPKGKKNSWECDIQCAIREFEEETKMSSKNISLCDKNCLIEIFRGSDNKLYSTHYYIAFTPDQIPVKRIETTGIRKNTVSEEILDVQWLPLEDSINKLNLRRKKLLEEVYLFISQKLQSRINQT